MMAAETVPGSYRDPGGQVYRLDGRILRTVMDCALGDYEFVRSTGLIEALVDEGHLIPAATTDPVVLGSSAKGARLVLEHPKLPFVSHPYEWPFAALKAAALLHLDVHLAALASNVTLSDASAYNVQFEGSKPIFIDHLSFRRYREGELWLGHRQFCEQFLNPLLLRAYLGIPHNAWYRGAQEGIATQDLSRLLPWRRKLSWNTLKHVVLHARLERSAIENNGSGETKSLKQGGLPRSVFEAMLQSLRNWIATLEPADTHVTIWENYATTHGYSDQEVQEKRALVGEFIAQVRPRLVWDLGCNTGDYASEVLDAGARHVVGFDFDHGALELAFGRAASEDLAFLPLFLDAANPSPNQGWAESERQGLRARAEVDALIALAFLHHLAIGRNIPLDQLVSWIVDLAPTGVIEFVPKTDPMVQRLLALREDIFSDYSEDSVLRLLGDRARIVKNQTISSTGRKLICYARS